MKKLIYILILIPFYGLNAQNSSILENYIHRGMQNNISLQKQTLELEKALNAIDLARSNYAPSLSFNPTYTIAAGGRKLSFPLGDLLNPVYGTLNQLTGSSNFPSIENETIQFAPNNFQETVIQFQYPIFNPSIKYNWIIQKDLLESEKAKRKVLEHELKYQISTAYLQYLMSLEGIKTINESLEFIAKWVVLNENLVKNKVALKDVVLSAKLEESKIKKLLVNAQKQSKLAQSYFNFLLNKPFESEIEADDQYSKFLPEIGSETSYLASSLQNRPEFLQLNAGAKVSETALIMAQKTAKLPEVFLGGNFGFQGFGYTFQDQAFAIGQIGLKWDLYHGKEKHYKIEKATIQKKVISQQVLEVQKQVQLQVTKAYDDLMASKEMLELTEPAILQSEGLLGLIETKYKNGAAINIEVQKAQNDMLTAKLDKVLAQFDMWIKKTELDKVSGL